MRLGIVSSFEVVTPEQITMIDKICCNLWEIPSSVRYYNLVTENSDDKDIRFWAELYFGCRFLTDSTDKLPRIKSVGSLSDFPSLLSPKGLKLSSGSSSSPRSNSPSPRLISPRSKMSPRNLSPTTLNNLQVISSNCNHVIVLGTPDNLGLVLKALGDMRIIILSAM